MAKTRDRKHADTDRQWLLLLQQAESEARAHLPPPPRGKPTPWREESITIVSATGERRNGVAMRRTAPFDPDEAARRFKREELLTPFRLDLEKLLKHNRKQQKMPTAFAEHAYRSYLALPLLALCHYANSNDLTPEERFIVGHNMAVLRMALRFPETQQKVNTRPARTAKNVAVETRRNKIKTIAKYKYQWKEGAHLTAKEWKEVRRIFIFTHGREYPELRRQADLKKHRTLNDDSQAIGLRSQRPRKQSSPA